MLTSDLSSPQNLCIKVRKVLYSLNRTRKRKLFPSDHIYDTEFNVMLHGITKIINHGHSHGNESPVNRKSKKKRQMTFRSRDFSTPQGPARGQLLNLLTPEDVSERVGNLLKSQQELEEFPDFNGPFLCISGVVTIKVTL